MNYNNLAKLCKEEADSALGEMTGSDIISRLAGILLAVSAVLDDGDDNNKPNINYRGFMDNDSDDKRIPL